MVDIDFKRTMNKLYFDRFLEIESKNSHNLYPDFLVFEPVVHVYKTKINNNLIN